METYKAHLVVKDYRQHFGIDYNEIFSLVVMLKSIRIMLAIAAHLDYEIWQMDVKTAFLNGELEEELYMIQSKGFIPQMSLRCASFKGPSMDLNRHLEVGTCILIK